jgi:spore germination protein GerM
MRRLLIVALVALTAATAAHAETRRAAAYFTKGEKIVPAPRPQATRLPAALRALVAGPTAAERAQGFRTSIPTGTRLLGVSVRDGVARVDLTRRFESGGGTASMTARLKQLVWTATQFPTVTSVRLLLNGKPVQHIGGEGVFVGKPLTR